MSSPVVLSYFLLISLSIVPYGLYWTYDIPGAIQNDLSEWFVEYTAADNLMLYSVYSYPNLLMPFVVGYLIDNLGVRMMTLMTAGFIFFGQVGFSVGVQIKLYWVCVLSRFVYGFGGEGLVVAQTKYLTRWFTGDQLGFYSGLLIGTARLGTSLSFILQPLMANNTSIPFTIWMGTLVCGISLASAAIAFAVDVKGERLGVVTITMVPPESNFKRTIHSLTEIFRFSRILWTVVFLGAFFYAAFITFLATASFILQKTGAFYTEAEASAFVSISNILSIFFPPIFGKIMDLKGYTLWWNSFGTFLQVLGLSFFLLFAMGNNYLVFHPIVVMCLIGIGYSIFVASYWPLIAFIVEESKVGRAYGLVTAMENLGYVVVPAVIGAIQTNIEDSIVKHYIAIDILLGLATITFIITIIFIIQDEKINAGMLNGNGDVKREVKERLKNHSTTPTDRHTGSDNEIVLFQRNKTSD